MILVWFIKVDDFPTYAANAKAKQLSDWVEKYKPFGDIEVMIIASNENKISQIKNEGDISGMSIEDIKNKIEDFVTINLDLKS